MNQKQELKILRVIDNAASNEERYTRKLRAVTTGVLIACFGLIIVVTFLTESGVVSHLVGMAIASVIGIVVGMSICYQIVATQWPVLREHLDGESIKARIGDLERGDT